MVKHTQIIRRLLRTNCLSVFDHFVELALKGLIFRPESAFNDSPAFRSPSGVFSNLNFKTHLRTNLHWNVQTRFCNTQTFEEVLYFAPIKHWFRASSVWPIYCMQFIRWCFYIDLYGNLFQMALQNHTFI